VVTVHDLNYLYGRNAFSTWRHGRRTRALLRRTDVLVAISQHTAADVRRHLGWKGEIPVIYNGARSFVDAPREPLPGWPATDTPPFLFHLSRMSDSKNPGAIIELARQWPQMNFLMCGPPSEDAKRLRDTVKLPNLQFHLGISDAHKAWAYAQCTGFLFPSLTEGFGCRRSRPCTSANRSSWRAAPACPKSAATRRTTSTTSTPPTCAPWSSKAWPALPTPAAHSGARPRRPVRLGPRRRGLPRAVPRSAGIARPIIATHAHSPRI
jgi:hypothetical protein